MEANYTGPRHMDPKLTMLGAGGRTRFSSDVPVVVLESRSGGRQEKRIRNGDTARVSHRIRVVNVWDAEIALTQLEDLAFDLGYI